MPACCRMKVTFGQRCRQARRRLPSGRRKPADRRSSHSRRDARRFFCNVGSAREIGAGGELILRVFVPLQLHAQAAHAAIFGQPVELRPHVVGEKIGIADDAVRKSGFVGGLLHIGDFVLEAVLRPIGLHIDGLRDAASRRCRKDIRRSDSRVGSPRRGRRCAAASARRARAGRAGARYDDVRRRCRVMRPSHSAQRSRTCAQMLSIEPPSAESSRSGRARDEACGARLEARDRRRAASAR